MKYVNLALILIFLLAACTPATGPALDTKPPTSSTPRIISTQTRTDSTTALPTKPSTTPESTLPETSSAAPPDELGQARDALVDFFDLLNTGDYAQAVELYGGGYAELIANNPDLDPQDRAGLIKRACEQNGYQCLKVMNIVSEQAVSPGEFHFIVEFLGRDGNRFVLGPCCGASETEMPPVWQFPYTVKKVKGNFQVMESPVFMP